MLLLLFGAESFVFQFATPKYEYHDTQTVGLPGVLYGCEALSPTMGVGRREGGGRNISHECSTVGY